MKGCDMKGCDMKGCDMKGLGVHSAVTIKTGVFACVETPVLMQSEV